MLPLSTTADPLAIAFAIQLDRIAHAQRHQRVSVRTPDPEPAVTLTPLRAKSYTVKQALRRAHQWKCPECGRIKTHWRNRTCSPCTVAKYYSRETLRKGAACSRTCCGREPYVIALATLAGAKVITDIRFPNRRRA